jgi:xylulokinase
VNPNAPFLFAVDAGTSSLKTVVYDHAGNVLSSANQRYGYSTPEAGWAEADPAAWWQALCAAVPQLHQAGIDLKEIQVVALTGQMHTAVLLDKNLEPLEPTLLWLDRRAARETVELQEKFKLPPYHLNSTYTLPKLFWLERHRPEVIQKTEHLLFPKDYLRFCLTGQIMTDYTEAGGAALLDWQSLQWAEERLEFCGIDPKILPPLHTPADDGGYLLPAIAEQFGLNPNARVLVGAGDVLALITGAPPAMNRLTCSLGSSSMIFCPIQERHKIQDPEDRIYTYPLLPYQLLGGVSSTTGAALHWAWQSLYQQEVSFEEAVSSALEIPAGSGGLFFLPFLSGERSPYWNDNIRGSFYGLTLAHSRPHLLRAVMEGVAYSLRYLVDIFKDLDCPIHEIALAGGGTATEGWPQIISDVCQLPVAIYAGQETVTHALYAYACEVMKNEPFEQALLRTFQPPVQLLHDEQTTHLFDRQYEKYHALADFSNNVLAESVES